MLNPLLWALLLALGLAGPDGCRPVTTMSNVELTLTLADTTFLETESIPFVVTLRNAGPEPLTLNDFEPANQSVTLVARGADEVMGTQISWKLRNGDRFHEPREFSTTELSPGQSVELKGDALEWLGVLPPGRHQLYAAYNSGAAIYEETEAVEIVVRAARPVSMAPAITPARPAFAKIPVAWQNSDEDGTTGLYLLDTSPHNPPNYFRNVRVATLQGTVHAVASVPLEESVTTTHVSWLDESGGLNIVSKSASRDVTDPVRLVPRTGGLTLLRPSVTDVEGNLHLVAASKDALFLLTIASGGSELRQVRLGESVPDVSLYSLLWGSDGFGHLLAKHPAYRDLSYARFGFLNEQAVSAANQVPDLKATIRALSIFQLYNVDTESYETQAVLLGESDTDAGELADVPGWQQWTLQLNEMTLRAPSPVQIPPGYHPVDMALNADNEARYLLASSEGALWFLDSESGLLPIRDDRHEPLAHSDQTVLIPTAPFSRIGSLFVGYIFEPAADTSRLVFQVLED